MLFHALLPLAQGVGVGVGVKSTKGQSSTPDDGGNVAASVPKAMRSAAPSS